MTIRDKHAFEDAQIMARYALENVADFWKEAYWQEATELLKAAYKVEEVMKIRIDELKPGMKVVTAKGIREIIELRRTFSADNGRVVYSWWATPGLNGRTQTFIGCGDLVVEVLDV